jgi:hypothetical protein
MGSSIIKHQIFIIFNLSVFILFISGFYSYAQNVSIGIRGGIGVPNLSLGDEADPLNTGYKSRFVPDAAVFAEFKLSDWFSIQPMLEYAAQGGKKTGLQAISTPDEVTASYAQNGLTAPKYLYANFTSEAKINYLMLPVLAKFSCNLGDSSPFRLYVDGGPFVGILLNANEITSGSGYLYTDKQGKKQLPDAGIQSFNTTQDIRYRTNITNIGAEGNIGIAYKLHRSSLFIEGGGNYGFLNIDKGADNGNNHTGAATASIGYAYWL